MPIAIIGTGLAGIATAKALIARGVKPVILDYGQTLSRDKSEAKKRLAKLEPSQWSDTDKKDITFNPTLYKKNTPIQKLAFGSDYFYGKSIADAPLEAKDSLPPFSYAKGGFSAGWGGSTLVPDDCDLNAWPIKSATLAPYFKKLLRELPYSAVDDGLSQHFPLYADHPKPLTLSQGNAAILADLNKVKKIDPELWAFGQARLLINSTDTEEDKGCKYCGYCMSGCVYDCIYKSSAELDKLVAAGKIQYQSGILVTKLAEQDDKVKVCYIDQTTHQAQSSIYDRVFLAAGALGSTRIVMQSKQLYSQEVYLKSTRAFVAPMLRKKSTPLEWPYVNTEPGIFIEFKVNDLSNHWIHTQLNTPNELVLEKLGVNPKKNNMVQAIKRNIAERLIIAFCNIHSDHANGYSLTLSKSSSDDKDLLISQRRNHIASDKAIKQISRKLFTLGRRFGCYTLLPLIQSSFKSTHVGSTLPMTLKQTNATDTDIMGRPKDWQRIHVVDSSIFPSLPATTIGLLAMANALRIATEVEL